MNIIIGVHVRFGINHDNDIAVVLNTTANPFVICNIFTQQGRDTIEADIRQIVKEQKYGEIIDPCDLSKEIYDWYIEYDISNDKFTFVGDFQNMNPHLFDQDIS